MKKRSKKPIRVFFSPLTDRFYATQSYRIEKPAGEDGTPGAVVITGKKFDVTQDIARAVVEEGITFIPAAPKDPKEEP